MWNLQRGTWTSAWSRLCRIGRLRHQRAAPESNSMRTVILLGFGMAMLAIWSGPNSAPAAEFVVAEGEKFQPQDEMGWRVTHQDDSWASHTYGGMWSTHGALLGAPADSVGSVAVQTVTIPAVGDYRVWSKHQAPPYFNYLHKVEIAQEGEVVFSHTYGDVNAVRMWSFNQGPLKQLWWFWGLDHDAAEAPREPVRLIAGAAEVRLITVPNRAPAGDVMVDFVALTTDTDDEAGNPRRLCVEALKSTQLYVRFFNGTDQPAQLTFRRPIGHWHPQWGGSQFTFPDQPVPAGQWSRWHNIGPDLELIHEDGQVVTLPGAEKIELQVALDAEGREIVGDVTVRQGETVVFPLDITWNKRPRMIASPMSATNSSSKHSTRTSSLSSFANACKGSGVPLSWNRRMCTQRMK